MSHVKSVGRGGKLVTLMQWLKLLTIPRLSCLSYQTAGEIGMIPPNDCKHLPSIVLTVCECEPIVSVMDNIQCDASACSSPDGSGGFRCVVKEEGYEEYESITCNSDSKCQHPSLVNSVRGAVEYTCCDIDDGSIENYCKTANPQCDIKACSSHAHIFSIRMSQSFATTNTSDTRAFSTGMRPPTTYSTIVAKSLTVLSRTQDCHYRRWEDMSVPLGFMYGQYFSS